MSTKKTKNIMNIEKIMNAIDEADVDFAIGEGGNIIALQEAMFVPNDFMLFMEEFGFDSDNYTPEFWLFFETRWNEGKDLEDIMDEYQVREVILKG